MEGVDEISMILGSTARDKDYEINNEHMKKTWERIHAPSTTDDEKRINMTSQNRKDMKDLGILHLMPVRRFQKGTRPQEFTKELGLMAKPNSTGNVVDEG